MKESIEIRNAGPLRHVYIGEVKPYIVLIGDSGSGKSVLMKTLMLMRYIYKMLNIRSALKNSSIKSPFHLNIRSLLHDDMANYFGPGKSGEVTYTVDDRYSIRIIKGRLETKGAEKIESSDLRFLKESWVTDMRSTIPLWLAKRGSLPESGFYFKETAEDFDKAADYVNELALPFIGMEMRVQSVGKKRKIYLGPTDGAYAPLELRNTSSGMQSSVPLLTLADYFASKFSFKDAIQRSIMKYLYMQDSLMQYRPSLEFGEMPRYIHMHIEEPELSLFPNAQCQMVEQLTGIVNNPAPDRHMYLIMATHSPYIVNYLNVLLRQPADKASALNSDNLAVYRIYEGELQSLMSRTVEKKWIVDTHDLTEPMSQILSEYRTLNRN